jgi:DNA-binding CsgD family transcriptional regulator
VAGLNTLADIEVASVEADHATWQGDLDQAGSAVQRALAITDANQVHLAQEMDDAWICAIGLAVQAERAERARAEGDAMALADATAAGRALLERVREGAERAQQMGREHDVYLASWHAKAEAEWTRLQGHSDPARWQAAAEAFSYGQVYEVARCQWRLAEALLGVGQREQAIVAARAACQTAVRLGAVPLRAALEALGRRARLEVGGGVGPTPRAAGLTPRELEVLRLLMAGRSNRQIAEELFISGKTASVHVTDILAKLGVHSRVEAAGRARDLGLDRPADGRR